MQLRSDGPSLKEMLKDAGNVTIADPAKYGHESYQAIEFRDSQLKHQRKALYFGDQAAMCYMAAMDDIQRTQERWEVTLGQAVGRGLPFRG